jgi:hypothetical protein
MRGRRGKRPPLRTCQDCGGHYYGWSGVLCPGCVKIVERPDESLRAYRRRTIGPNR